MRAMFLGGILCVANCLHADEYHYNNLLIGSNALGVGGAYIAVADDLSATHYNPAGLSFAESGQVASINTFAWEQSRFTGIFSTGEDFTRDSFSLVPGFFGGNDSIGAWSFAVSLAVADFSRERTSTDALYQLPASDQSPARQVTEFINFDLDNAAYKLALSVAYKASPSLSWGLSLQTYYRDFHTVQGSGVENIVQLQGQTLTNGFQAFRRYEDVSVAVEPMFGVMWRNKNWRAGARLSKEWTLSRDHDSASSIVVAGNMPLPPSIVTSYRESISSGHKQDSPLQAGVGLAWLGKDWRFSADVTHFSSVKMQHRLIDGVFPPITRDLNPVTNYAVGAQYQLSKTSSLSVGIFTDNSNGKIDTSIDFQRVEDIDLLGISLGVQTRVFGYPVALGVYHKSGEGNVRYADLRFVEAVVGLPLYPDDGNFNITRAKKRVLVAFLSLDF